MLSHERPKPKYTQTIEELLGLPAKRNADSAMPAATNLVRPESVERPSTRHGRRDSIASPPKENSNASTEMEKRRRWSRADHLTNEQESNLERIESNRSLVPTVKQNVEMHQVHRHRSGSLSSKNSVESTNRKIKIPALEVSSVAPEFVNGKSGEKRLTYRKSSSAKERPKSVVRRKNSLPRSTMSESQVGAAKGGGESSHKAWLDAKIREQHESRRKLKTKEELEKQKLEQRKEDAKRSFEIWKQRQDEKTREQLKKQKEAEDEKRKKEKEEKLRKNEEAGKVFEAWKHARESSFMQEREKADMKRKAELDKKEKEKATRELEKNEAIDVWLENKRIQEEEAKRRQEDEQIEKEEKEVTEKEYKDTLASEAYSVWLDMKDKERDFMKSVANRILTYEEEAKKRWSAPWLPTSNSVPRHFVGSGNRRKSLDPRRTLKHSRPPTRAPRSTSVR